MVRLSLIIATYNRSASLIQTLQSVVEQNAPRNEWECVVVTGDRDSLQLIDENIHIKLVISKPGQTTATLYDREKFREEYGFEPGKMVDLKALMGDSSDNIAGIRGMRSTKIKQIIEVLGKNYDFQALRESGLLSEEHIATLTRNLDVMRLDKLLEHPNEMEYYESQFNAPTKINKELFRTHVKNFQFLEILKKFESWFKTLSLEKQRETKKNFSDYADILQD